MDNRVPSVAVVIATYNRDEPLRATIGSLLECTPPPDEVWIIDQSDAHDVETEAYFATLSDRGCCRVRLEKASVCFARNLGAALAQSDVVLYLDDDVLIPDRDFIDRHRRNYNDPAVQAVQGQVLENPERLGRRVAVGPDGHVPLIAGGPAEWTDIVVTANFSIRRRVLIESAGYDEGFSGRTYANEDGDFGLRLASQGRRIDFDPEARVIHIRAPMGGNRLTARDSWPEWTRSVTFFQYWLRHGHGRCRYVRLLCVFRLIALRKDKVLRPWLIPHALLSACYGLAVAIGRHRAGLRSSLLSPGAAELRRRYLGDAVARP
jgi:glycosyltransferase involved in cell wall biosynthesis